MLPIKKIMLKASRITILVDIEEILYCKTNKSGSTCFFLKDNETLLSSRNIGYFESLLSKNYLFLRTHNSYLVNFNAVKKSHCDVK